MKLDTEANLHSIVQSVPKTHVGSEMREMLCVFLVAHYTPVNPGFIHRNATDLTRSRFHQQPLYEEVLVS